MLFLLSDPVLLSLTCGVLGLIIGSFLNVVIVRLAAHDGIAMAQRLLRADGSTDPRRHTTQFGPPEVYLPPMRRWHPGMAQYPAVELVGIARTVR